MKIFYPNGKIVNKKPILSYETLESGRVVMWHDKTINSLLIDTKKVLC